MTAALWIAGACGAWLGLCWAVIYIWSRRQPVERRCSICGGPIGELEPWRWATHLDGPVHWGCVPAILRAAGSAYVSLWLDQGDALRTLSSIVESEEVAS